MPPNLAFEFHFLFTQYWAFLCKLVLSGGSKDLRPPKLYCIIFRPPIQIGLKETQDNLMQYFQSICATKKTKGDANKFVRRKMIKLYVVVMKDSKSPLLTLKSAKKVSFMSLMIDIHFSCYWGDTPKNDSNWLIWSLHCSGLRVWKRKQWWIFH